MKLIFFMMIFLSNFGAEAGSANSGPKKDQKVILKLLEPISPQKHAEEGETITSNLGEILEDPKNEALKAVKVLGRKKRLEGPARAIKITWEEVALDVQLSAEQAAKGMQVPAVNSLKEPVKKPLQSAFVQKTPDAIESGTLIEAKGDVDGLLAAARSLLIRAQKQGFNVVINPISPGLGMGYFKAREKGARGDGIKKSSLALKKAEGKPDPGGFGGEKGNQRKEQSYRDVDEGIAHKKTSSSRSEEDPQYSFRSTSREGQSAFSSGSFSQSSSSRFASSNPYSFTSSRGSGFESSYQGGSPWPKRDKKKKEKETEEKRSVFSSPEDEAFPSRGSSSVYGFVDRNEGNNREEFASFKEKKRKKRREKKRNEEAFSVDREEGSVRGDEPEHGDFEDPFEEEGEDSDPERERDEADEDDPDSESEIGSSHGRKTKKPGKMGHHRRKGMRREGPLDAGLDEKDAEFDYPFGVGREGGGEEETHIPVITVEYDYESCSPRIDFSLKQVILGARAITFKDGIKSSESDCADTPKRFPIKKDYTHPDCVDVIERNLDEGEGADFGFAYATYKPYWMNESSERQYLGNVQKDEKHPFALREEEGSCLYAVDLENLEAKPQSELVYENRSKRRIVVEPCRPSVRGTPVRITPTRKGCGYVHQFDANRSMPQQRLVYTVKGAEYEALPCHDASDTWTEHQFDTSVCKPIVYEDTLTQQPFARRFIQTTEGKLWLSECEPYGSRGALLTDAAACLTQPYHHDILGKQSYLNVRYYYNRPRGKKYVTGCQPGTDVFVHHKIVVGYVHDDVRKISKLKVEISFDHSGRKIIVVPAQVDETETPAPYVRLRETTDPAAYQTKMNDRCYQEQRFKKHNIYQRADRTEYLDRIDDKVQTVDRCVRTKEKREEPCFVTWMNYQTESWGDNIVNNLSWGNVVLRNYGNCSIDGRTLWEHFPSRGYLWKTDRLMERLKTVYPDSPHPEYTSWEWTGYYRDHSVTACHRGADGAHPPVEGKTWHHTERKFSPIPG